VVALHGVLEGRETGQEVYSTRLVYIEGAADVFVVAIVAARISNVATDTNQFRLGFADPGVAAKTATEVAFGINWILNNNVKYSIDYADIFFRDGASTNGNVTDRPAESVFETQLQIAF